MNFSCHQTYHGVESGTPSLFGISAIHRLVAMVTVYELGYEASSSTASVWSSPSIASCSLPILLASTGDDLGCDWEHPPCTLSIDPPPSWVTSIYHFLRSVSKKLISLFNTIFPYGCFVIKAHHLIGAFIDLAHRCIYVSPNTYSTRHNLSESHTHTQNKLN